MSFRHILEKWLLVWLCLGCLVSYLWTDFFPATFDPFVSTRQYLSYFIIAIMFCVGCLLPPDELQQVGRSWPTVLIGTILQYAVMPLLAVALGLLFSLSGDEWIGLMIVGCVPGAMASNLLTLIARGNVSYSISLTTLATLLSPLVVPLTLYLTLQEHVRVQPLRVFLTLTVVAPVVVGFFLCRKSSRIAHHMTYWGPVIANLAVLWVIWAVVGINRKNLSQVEFSIIGILLILNVLGYVSGYTGAALLRLPEGMRRALTIEVGMQNAGLGAALAVEFFPSRPASAIPPALYTFGCMLTGLVLAQFWAFWSARSEKSLKPYGQSDE